jgi:hypothetical protein
MENSRRQVEDPENVHEAYDVIYPGENIHSHREQQNYGEEYGYDEPLDQVLDQDLDQELYDGNEGTY